MLSNVIVAIPYTVLWRFSISLRQKDLPRESYCSEVCTQSGPLDDFHLDLALDLVFDFAPDCSQSIEAPAGFG